MLIILRREPRPGERPLACPANEATVAHHHEHAALAIRFVRDRVPRQDVRRTSPHEMAARHGHRVQERDARSVGLQRIALHVRLRQKERALLVRSDDDLRGSEKRLDDVRRRRRLVCHLQLQLVGRLLLQDVRQRLGRLGLRLHE